MKAQSCQLQNLVSRLRDYVVSAVSVESYSAQISDIVRHTESLQHDNGEMVV